VICRDHSANLKRWATRSELRYAIGTWIERTSNRRRRQRALGRLTPVESELASPVSPPWGSMISHNWSQLNVQQTRSTELGTSSGMRSSV
jgi:hypothetical protein